jgi:hypothetical protein
MMLRFIKRSRLWSCAIAILMAAQVALAFHTVEHQVGAEDFSQAEHCALCQVASGMDAPPAVAAVEPVTAPLDFVRPTPSAPVPSVAPASGFHARAPPTSFV